MYEAWAKVALRAIGDTYRKHRAETDTRHILEAVHAAMERQPERIREAVPEDVRDGVILSLAWWWLHKAFAAEVGHNVPLKAVRAVAQEPPPGSEVH